MIKYNIKIFRVMKKKIKTVHVIIWESWIGDFYDSTFAVFSSSRDAIERLNRKRSFYRSQSDFIYESINEDGSISIYSDIDGFLRHQKFTIKVVEFGEFDL